MRNESLIFRSNGGEGRTIVHLDMDTFFVSAERLYNSKLEGKPVIIGGMGDRGVVAACSYEARRFGVHSAMPMRMARMLCPEAIFIRGDMEPYSRLSRMVTQIIAEKAPSLKKPASTNIISTLPAWIAFSGATSGLTNCAKPSSRTRDCPYRWDYRSTRRWQRLLPV